MTEYQGDLAMCVQCDKEPSPDGWHDANADSCECDLCNECASRYQQCGICRRILNAFDLLIARDEICEACYGTHCGICRAEFDELFAHCDKCDKYLCEDCYGFVNSRTGRVDCKECFAFRCAYPLCKKLLECKSHTYFIRDGFGGPYCIDQCEFRATDREYFGRPQWRAITDLWIGLEPLKLPTYVLMWIDEWASGRGLIDHEKMILLEGLQATRRRQLQARERRCALAEEAATELLAELRE